MIKKFKKFWSKEDNRRSTYSAYVGFTAPNVGSTVFLSLIAKTSTATAVTVGILSAFAWIPLIWIILILIDQKVYGQNQEA